MDIEALRRYCLGFRHTSENVQWGSDLCFKVDGKLFVVAALEPGPVRLCFKCSPEVFAELCERPGARPAPYMARAQWIALEQFNTLPDSELRELISDSYRLVFARLTKKRQQQLDSAQPAAKPVARTGTRDDKKVRAPVKTKRAKAGK